MPKLLARCISSRLNSYPSKRGYVEERILTFTDEEATPAARYLSTLDLVLTKGTPAERDFPDEKVINKVCEVGVQSIEERNGRQQIRIGAILSVQGAKNGQ